MKIRMMKRAGIFLIAAAMVFTTATGAFALAYYEAGSADNNTSGTALVFQNNNKTFSFASNYTTGPAGGGLDAFMAYYQSISGSYTINQALGNNVYSLTGGASTIRVRDSDLNNVYLQATATATQIDLTNHTIAWTGITMGSIDTSNNAQSLIDIQAVKDAGGAFQFSSFTFEGIGALNTWLGGGAGGNARYYSNLEGIAAAPEPAEWVLMFIGLGMLGFYLQRRGYLNFDLSPQSVA
jgi:hypothetical protein